MHTFKWNRKKIDIFEKSVQRNKSAHNLKALDRKGMSKSTVGIESKQDLQIEHHKKTKTRVGKHERSNLFKKSESVVISSTS